MLSCLSWQPPFRSAQLKKPFSAMMVVAQSTTDGETAYA